MTAPCDIKAALEDLMIRCNMCFLMLYLQDTKIILIDGDRTLENVIFSLF